MEVRDLICVECPFGCRITVEIEKDKILSVSGNNCPRGKAYVESEVICPKRILTSTARAENGEMVSVKTDKPVPKDKMFDVMKIINATHCKLPVKLGDVIIANVFEDVNVIATCNAEK